MDLLNAEGESPLSFASSNGHSNLVQALVHRGCKINHQRQDGCTPLFLASMNRWLGKIMNRIVRMYLDLIDVQTLWVAAKLNPQISPRRVLDMFYPMFCFQQTFWLNIRQSMSPLNNIYISRRIFLHWKLKNRVKIKESVKIKNWRRKFFGFFFIFFGSNDKK